MHPCSSNISSGQILSCEYTVHPRWLTDNNDGTEHLWPENLPKQSSHDETSTFRQRSQDEMELVQDEVVIEEPAPIDFDWVEERETEDASNCEDIIFEQDIPATLEEEVVIGSEETEFDDNENSDCCSQSSQESEHGGNSTKYSNQCNQIPDAYVPESSNSQSISKRNTLTSDKIKRPTVKFKQTLMVSKNLLILNQRNFPVDPKAGTSLLKSELREKSNDGQMPEVNAQKHESKFSVKVKLDSRLAKSLKKSKSPHKQKHRGHITGHTKVKTVGKHSESLSGKAKKFVDIHGENITINHDADDCKPNSIDDTCSIDSQLNDSKNKVSRTIIMIE